VFVFVLWNGGVNECVVHDKLTEILHAPLNDLSQTYFQTLILKHLFLD